MRRKNDNAYKMMGI